MKLYEQTADGGKTWTKQWLSYEDIENCFYKGIHTRELGSNFILIPEDPAFAEFGKEIKIWDHGVLDH